MNPAIAIALLLAAAVVLSGWRTWRRPPATSGATPVRRGHPLLRWSLQATGALLLYLTLFPPPRALPAPELTVLTAGAEAGAPSPQARAGRVLALPEADAAPGIERVPDLATALRRYAAHGGVRVVGAGLPVRDQAAARGLWLQFEPAPLPRGLVELDALESIRSGLDWTVAGRVENVPGGTVALLDPAGETMAKAVFAEDGRFALHAQARLPGRALFRLRMLDAQGQPVEEVAVPLLTVPGDAPRVLLRSGAPNPELKYLRRWAVDAGVELSSSLDLTAGVRLQDKPVPLTAEALSGFDLLILDERAFAELSAAERRSLDAAVEAGLGLLRRLSAEPSAREREMLHIVMADAVPLLRDAGGQPLAQWWAQGQGRVALWWLTDSYRMVLAGDAPRHAALWSRAVSTLARARGRAEPDLRGADPRENERVVWCGLAPDASILDPAGAEAPLRIDPAAGSDHCAAYWPDHPGWHRLRRGAGTWPFYVRAAAEAPGLRAAALREATARLAAAAAAPPPGAPVIIAGPAWPYFLGWLLLSAWLWWRERRQRRDFPQE